MKCIRQSFLSDKFDLTQVGYLKNNLTFECLNETKKN